MNEVEKNNINDNDNILSCIMLATRMVIEITILLLTYPLFYALNHREERIVERMMRLEHESNK